MDCNKEDALKAKQLAEKKMEIKDFYGALKNAVKAQQLYPELENISQLIVVCEVHCSAEKKLYGVDKDWYGILKIEPSADETSIKKQYRKLALILHPDKNKFSGSTDAFKLIGEAQRVLLDREKRVTYDNKRRTFGNVPNWAPRPPNRQPSAHHQHPWNVGTPVNLYGGRSGNFQFTQHQPQTGASGKPATFWTVCAFCSVRYQFYRDDVLNKVIHCQTCKKSFTAFELNAQGTTPAVPSTTQARKEPSFSHQTTIPRTYSTKPVFEKKEPPKAQGNANANKKRKKRIEESSESSDSSESSESEEEAEDHSESEGNGVPNNVDMNPDNEGEQPRRSSRSKRNVSYKENVNDIDNDDDATPSKPEVKKVAKEDHKKSQKNGKEHQKPNSDNKGGEKANGNHIEDDDEEEEEETEPEVYDCPDPEFSDFDKNRSEESFKVGQIWACYDTDDAMPRFYAYIKKVITPSPGFKLQIQWLKPDPGNDHEKKWVKKDLPVSCGNFKRGRPEKAEDILSFSHVVKWEEEKAGPKAGTINIIPRKEEIWALFKNWSMNWHSSDDDDEERKYEYEFVEILSNYDETLGVRVSYLEKVKGFVCLFKRKKDAETVIPGSDKYRFAHMIPSYKMSGEEKEGVPKGSVELDPAALPLSTFEQVNL